MDDTMYQDDYNEDVVDDLYLEEEEEIDEALEEFSFPDEDEVDKTDF